MGKRKRESDPSFLWPYGANGFSDGACHVLFFSCCFFLSCLFFNGANEWAARSKRCMAAFVRGGAAGIQSAPAMYGRLISQEPLFRSVLSSSFPGVVGTLAAPL